MKIYSKEEWAREPFKGLWNDSRETLERVAAGKVPAGYIGRRHAIVKGENGAEVITEGVDFLVADDYGHLPVLNKFNAMEWACYQFSGGYIQVTKVYRITEEFARKCNLYCLDRADFIQYNEHGMYPGGCGLPGGEMRKD